EAAAVAQAAVRSRAAGSANHLVIAERAVGNGQDRAASVPEAAAGPVAARGAGGAGAADGPIIAEHAVANRQRATEAGQPAPLTVTATEPAHDEVGAEGAVKGGQGAGVVDAAAPGQAARGTEGLVGGQGAGDEGQVAGVGDPAPVARQAVRDRQGIDLRR